MTAWSTRVIAGRGSCTEIGSVIEKKDRPVQCVSGGESASCSLSGSKGKVKVTAKVTAQVQAPLLHPLTCEALLCTIVSLGEIGFRYQEHQDRTP